MKIIDCEQNSVEWRMARLGIPTASCFAQVLSKGKGTAEAVGRRNLRAKLALERDTGKLSAEGFKNDATEQGHEREPLACQAYEVETGRILHRVGFCRHDTLETGCSPDALIGDEGSLEVKSPNPPAHMETLELGAVPSQYVAQVQGVMWICERKWLDFVSFNPDFRPALRLKIVRVLRDEAYIDRLRIEVSAFLQELRAEVANFDQLEQRLAA